MPTRGHATIRLMLPHAGAMSVMMPQRAAAAAFAPLRRLLPCFIAAAIDCYRHASHAS